MQTCSWHAFNLVCVGKGSGVSSIRLLCACFSNIDRLLAREWCLLSAAFAVNSRHRTAAFTASLMLRRLSRRTRPPKLQVRSRRALAIPPQFPEQKEKNSFHEWHNGGGVRANLKTTIEVTNSVVCVDLHAGDAGWRAARHQAACMFELEGRGSQHHVGFLACFWVV